MPTASWRGAVSASSIQSLFRRSERLSQMARRAGRHVRRRADNLALDEAAEVGALVRPIRRARWRHFMDGLPALELTGLRPSPTSCKGSNHTQAN